MIGSELVIGSIYDIYGRKKPLIITYFMASMGLFITPFFSSVYPWYQLSMVLKSIENVTALVPFIPDLLMEESHSIGNAFRILAALLGTLFSTLLLGISSKGWISDTNIYLVVTALNTLMGFYIIFHMKDIINS